MTASANDLNGRQPPRAGWSGLACPGLLHARPPPEDNRGPAFVALGPGGAAQARWTRVAGEEAWHPSLPFGDPRVRWHRGSGFLRTGGSHALASIRRNDRFWKEDRHAALAIVLATMADTTSPRNDIPWATRRLGCTIWKRWSGYHVRSRVEARMRNLKSLGERIASRDPDRQTADIHIRIALMSRVNALGTAEIERVA